MLKRILILLICASLISASASAAYYSDIDDPELSAVAQTLSVTGIIEGMGDGTFNPDGLLTREQFAKIAVCVLGEKEKAVSSAAATAFTDVLPDSWANGYISYVAANGIIAGFPDGSFGGAQALTYAQAAAILLRCLGYTDEEIGYHWPSDCIAKAAAVGIDEGVSLSANDGVTRATAAKMVYNALFTELNGSDEKLISKTGITVYEDAVIYGRNKSDSSLVETDAGSFRLADGAIGVDEGTGKEGDIFVNKDKRIILFKSNVEQGVDIVIASCFKNEPDSTIDIGWSGGTISLPNDGIVYSGGEKTTALAAFDDMTVGSRLSVYYDKNGTYSSAVLDSYALQGPKTVTEDYNQIYTLFSVGSAPTVIRKGVASSIEEISRFDVVYYAQNTNTVYAYDDKVSGIYEKASPIKSDVTKITVSGSEYEIASSTALGKLNESAGAFSIGDFVTLLLDKNGDIADVVDTSASYISNMGVVLSGFSRVNDDGTQEYAVKIFVSDGSTMEYAADRDYEKFKGELVRFSFKDGKAVLSRVSPVVKSGKINKELRSLGSYWLASDCSILTLVSNPEDGEASVRKIRFSDIEGTELRSSQVIHVELVGDMNDIALIYLKNVNKDDYEYGVITRLNKDGYDSCDILIHGEEKSLPVGRRVFSTSVVGVSTLDSSDFTDGIRIGSGRKITAVSGDKLKVDNTVYKTASDFDIYLLSGINDYSLISVEDAMALSSGEVTVYGDKDVDDGGKVRLVIIK